MEKNPINPWATAALSGFALAAMPYLFSKVFAKEGSMTTATMTKEEKERAQLVKLALMLVEKIDALEVTLVGVREDARAYAARAEKIALEKIEQERDFEKTNRELADEIKKLEAELQERPKRKTR